jgi:putative peptide zinc metalloprotease protein
MISADKIVISSSARPLPLVMRRDLVIRPMKMRGRTLWVVKDPVAVRYHQLREEEFFVIGLLDGRTSSDEIRRRFAERFAPRELELPRLQSFLVRLHREGLVVSQAIGQGAELIERRRKLTRQAWLETASNLLALRFRGIDPQRFLDWLAPFGRRIFSRWFLVASLLLIASAVGLLVLHLDTLQQRLPEFRAFFGGHNLIWLVVAVAIAKVLHELGHALACRRFGGECHEIGLMLLVFTPCLYCDVSDAWLMSNKWRRIAIGAAGMWVEMILASIATFVWWWTGPGILNGLCLDIMFVCSVSTVLFNGNPLLRYDGYYILSDFVEVPNLQEQATQVVRRWFARWAFGIDLPPDRLSVSEGQVWLALYAITSTVYRLCVVVAILWFLQRVLKPYGLDVVASLLGVLAVGGMLVTPLIRSARWVRDQQRSEPLNWGRFLIRTGLVVAAIGVIAAIPLPRRITTAALVEPSGAARVYVTVPGTLLEAAQAGQTVRAGEPVAHLENLELDLELTKLEGDRDREALHIKNLRGQQGSDPAAAAQIPTAEEALADLETRLAEQRRDRDRLTLSAPRDGTVFPPHRQSRPTPAGELATWTETPLDPRNRGAYLETGTIVCLVGDPQRLEATLLIDQSDVDLVRVGQKVQIRFDETPGRKLDGTVASIGELDLKVAPNELVVAGDLPSRIDESGNPRPISATYQARVELSPSDDFALRSGAIGRAKISVESASLARRLIRYLSQTLQSRS